jgi:predicted metal-dependent phosphotriesterase family hydrolase
MENLPRRVLPLLREAGASQAEIDQMLVSNTKRLLEPALERASRARAPEEIR